MSGSVSRVPNKIEGVLTALITPFRDGHVDFESLSRLVEYQVRQNVRGIVITSTTGEFSTLDDDERCAITEHVVAIANRRIQVWAGTGSNCTSQSVRYTRRAHEIGVDGMLVVAPYYNRPNQEGLYLHFSHIAETTDKPILLYSIPVRCGVEIGVATIEQLRRSFANIVGIKESGNSCNRVSQIVKTLDDSFVVLSGDDSLTLPFIALGAKGVVSVASNWIAKALDDMVRLALNNELERASFINGRYYPFFKALFLEPNPVPIKYVLYKTGLIPSPEVRLPLCTLNDHNVRILTKHLDVLQAQ
jgi:4-hydroxy-tetrahydrodipicolinate synthase